MHPGFPQQLVTTAPGILGELPAVILCVGHVAVRRLLGVRQDPDGLDVGVLRTQAGLVIRIDDAPAQPLDLLP